MHLVEDGGMAYGENIFSSASTSCNDMVSGRRRYNRVRRLTGGQRFRMLRILSTHPEEYEIAAAPLATLAHDPSRPTQSWTANRHRIPTNRNRTLRLKLGNKRIFFSDDQRRPDNYTELTVANSGCHLCQADVRNVFDHFWRGDISRSSTGAHSGLGQDAEDAREAEPWVPRTIVATRSRGALTARTIEVQNGPHEHPTDARRGCPRSCVLSQSGLI